jgi:hypothetical protein
MLVLFRPFLVYESFLLLFTFELMFTVFLCLLLFKLSAFTVVENRLILYLLHMIQSSCSSRHGTHSTLINTKLRRYGALCVAVLSFHIFFVAACCCARCTRRGAGFGWSRPTVVGGGSCEGLPAQKLELPKKISASTRKETMHKTNSLAANCV